MAFNGGFANVEDLTAANEWALTSIVSCIAHDDADLHAKLIRDIMSLTLANAGSIGAIRLDVLQVAALMEVLFPAKYATLSTEHDVLEMSGSDPFTFNSCYSDEIKPLTEPIVLTTT